jgi:methylglutaconyl-CoA hydratase
VHQVASADQLDAGVDAIAKSIASNSPNAVRECKRLVADLAGQDIGDALIADTADRIARVRASDEGREGVRSFLEKRKPSWLG